MAPDLGLGVHPGVPGVCLHNTACDWAGELCARARQAPGHMMLRATVEK